MSTSIALFRADISVSRHLKLLVGGNTTTTGARVDVEVR